MIPLIVQRMARHAGWTPRLRRVVPNIPFISACDAALVSPNVGLAVYELVDVELQGLKLIEMVAEEVNVVNKVAQVGVDAVVEVRHSLRRELPDQVVVPKHIGVLRLAADCEFHGFAAQGGRAYTLTAEPCGLWATGPAGGANPISGR